MMIPIQCRATMIGTIALREVMRFKPIPINIVLTFSPMLNATENVMKNKSKILAKTSWRIRRNGLGLNEKNIDLEYSMLWRPRTNMLNMNIISAIAAAMCTPIGVC